MIRPDILLVADKAQARRNRQRVANKENIQGYLAIENMVQGFDLTEHLPKRIPVHDEVFSWPRGKISDVEED